MAELSRRSILIISSGIVLAVFLGSMYQKYLDYTQRFPKQKRVYVDMVADLFHSGHVNFLRQAKEHGDYLIVGISSDDDAASYKRRPIMALYERVKLVESCKYVDEVIPACPLKLSKEFIQEHRIDLVLHGDDWPQTMLDEYYQVPIALGIFKTVPYTKTISTTALLQRVHEYFQPEKERSERCADPRL